MRGSKAKIDVCVFFLRSSLCRIMGRDFPLKHKYKHYRLYVINLKSKLFYAMILFEIQIPVCFSTAPTLRPKKEAVEWSSRTVLVCAKMTLDRIQLCNQLWLELLIETLTSQKIRYYTTKIFQFIALKRKIFAVF